jgi:hypothetical protein
MGAGPWEPAGTAGSLWIKSALPRPGHSPGHGWCASAWCRRPISPDDPTLQDYWRQRRNRPRALAGRPWQLASRQQGLGPVGHQLLENGEDLDVHHVLPKKQGGMDGLANLRLAHANGHGRFIAPGRLLGYVDGLSRILGDGYARF